MTRTTSFVAILALVVLVLVPAAWGSNQDGDAFARTAPVDFWNYEPQTGAKIADTSPGVAPRDIGALYAGAQAQSPDVFERAVQSRQQSQQQSRPTFVGGPDAIDRAIAAREAQQVAVALDARERALIERQSSTTTAPPDAFERALGSRPAKGDRTSLGRDPWLAQEQRDLSAEAPRAVASPTVATSSDDDLEWLQIGIGLGSGIVLAFGLFLGMRLVRIRPPAY